ncbi:MAG TPA: hypothetical protein VFF26_04815 [Gallionella sp.]|nr:hypothetical protein [Gallionella sp.]
MMNMRAVSKSLVLSAWQRVVASCVLLGRSRFFPVVLLAMAVFALYGQFLWNPVIFDDANFFSMDEDGHQPVSDFRFSLLELRSLPYATLAWGKDFLGLDLRHFRIENMLLHFAVTLVLYFFLHTLVKLFSDRASERSLGPRSTAFIGALIFALHPVATYATGYLVQRTILMATLFSLLAMLSYLHGSLRQNPRWLWACVPFYYLAVFSKEHSIMLPAVLVALTVLLHEDWFAQLKRRWAIFLALGLIALFVIAAKIGVLGKVYEFDAPEMLDMDNPLNYPLSVLTQSWLFFKYIGLWLFPNPGWMSIDMREPFADSLMSRYALAMMAFIAYGAFAARLLLKRGRIGLVGLAMLFPWLMFMTEFSSVRIQESFVLYRSYLWMAGACCVIPIALDLLRKRMAVAIATIIALAMIPVSMDRLATFSHPLLLWEDAAKLVENRHDLPGVYRIYLNRGTARHVVNNFDGAIEDYKLSLKLRPDWPHSYNNLGVTYIQKKDWPAAVEAFTHAIDIARAKKTGMDISPYFGRALAFEKLGRIDLAKRDYQETCRVLKRGCDKL